MVRLLFVVTLGRQSFGYCVMLEERHALSAVRGFLESGGLGLHLCWFVFVFVFVSGSVACNRLNNGRSVAVAHSRATV